MLFNICAALFFLFAMGAIGFGVYQFVHQQVANSVLLFILGGVALNFAANLLLVRMLSPVEGWLGTLFKELDGFYKDVIEIRDSIRGWEVKVARHDDLLEIRETLEEMKTEVTDRSDLIEETVMKFLARDKKKGDRNPEAG